MTKFIYSLLLMGALLLPSQLFAQRKVPTADQMLGANDAQGTEFWIGIPGNERQSWPTVALEFYIAAEMDTEVEVYDPASNYRKRRAVKAGSITTLSTNTGDLFWTWENWDYEQVIRKGIRITAAKPISVYVLNSKQTSSDGYLAIPITSWGKVYRACTYFDFNEVGVHPWAGGFMVVAKEDGTVVKISLKGQGGSSAKTKFGKKIGDVFSITMDAGDVYSIAGDATTRGIFDLTGSLIEGSKPIGLIPFHERTTMPNLLTDGNGRNNLLEMMPPLNTWGKKYVTIEYAREHKGVGRGDVFRVVASQDGTKWSCKYYNPKPPFNQLGSDGGVLAKAGDFADRSQSGAPSTLINGISVWEADKPVFVMQYSCSQSWDQDPDLDPFMINVANADQFITSTIYQAPTLANFPKHRLNLVVYADVNDPNYSTNLKSLAIDGVPVWSHPRAAAPLLTESRLPGTNYHFAVIIHDREPNSHQITCNGKVKFGGYIYGYGAADAYGWPAAAGFKPIDVFDTLPPVLKRTENCGDFEYEATELRNIPDPPRTPAVDSDQVETGVFMIDSLPDSRNGNYRLVMITTTELTRENKVKRVKFRWEVIDRTKDAFVKFYVKDWADNSTIDSIFYRVPNINISPNPIAFGKRRVGSGTTMQVTIRNDQTGPDTLREVKLLLGNPRMRIIAGMVPPEVTLAPGGTHVITVEYSAAKDSSEVGTEKDTVIVRLTCGEFKVPVSGFAVEPIIKVEDFKAGILSVNEKRCKQGGLRIDNVGSDTLVITTITGYAGTNFTLSAGFTPALPIRIPPKGNVYLKDVCYQRSSVGQDSIVIIFGSNTAVRSASGELADSASDHTGATDAPGPLITNVDWRERRVNSLWSSMDLGTPPIYVDIKNTGNQVLNLNNVTFADGSKYFPAGSDENSYVFKIGNILYNGTAPAAASQALTGNGTTAVDSVRVEVWFRPAAEQAYHATVHPVWQQPGTPEREGTLDGIGILPQLTATKWTATCEQTPFGVEYSGPMVLTNAGTMDVTVSAISLSGATDNTQWKVNGIPASLPFTIAPGGTRTLDVVYTRRAGFSGSSIGTVVINHDATRGNGISKDGLEPVPALNTEFNVGSCSGPDIVVTGIDYGRNLASCDVPTASFTISNTGGGSTPLEIRDLIPTGADAAFFTITAITNENGVAIPYTTTPFTSFTIAAGTKVTVAVRFTPTEPNVAPWTDRNYSVRYHVMNYAEGDARELVPDVYSTVVGVGYVVPVTVSLSNDLTPGATKRPGENVLFTVRGASTGWPQIGMNSMIVDVIYSTRALSIDPTSVVTIAPGFTIAPPLITSLADGIHSQARFALQGGTITGDGTLFTFRSTLLLSEEFTSQQTLNVSGTRPCAIISTSGDSTTVFNCALTRRVVTISAQPFALRSPAPNPSTGGIARMDFAMGLNTDLTIDMVDNTGQVVRTMVQGKLPEGEYTMEFETSDLSSGVYFVRMNTSSFSKTVKVMIAN